MHGPIQWPCGTARLTFPLGAAGCNRYLAVGDQHHVSIWTLADEDPQTVHGIVAAKQLEQQLPVRAQVNFVTGLDRVLGRRRGAKQEPHGPEVNGSAEVHLVAHLREALEIGKETRGPEPVTPLYSTLARPRLVSRTGRAQPI